MNIYNFYESWAMIARMTQTDDFNRLLVGLGFGAALWLALFVLQGVGLYVMAKNKNVKKSWLAFVPIANVYLIGKLVGDCDVFGHKVKRLGVYTMIAQALCAVVCFSVIGAELYLYAAEGSPILGEGSGVPFWTDLNGFSLQVAKFYDISSFIVSIIVLVYEIMFFLLLTGLYKQYNPQNYFFLSMLALFVPLSPYIAIFALRKRKAINYEAYMQARREAFFRQQQQYRNMYGNPQNPYTNTYTWGTPPSGNPYTREQAPKKPDVDDEPFAEFSSSEKSSESKSEPSNGNDDFFA